jgi:hypothetical protein
MKPYLFMLLGLVLFSQCTIDNDTAWVFMNETGCPPGWVDESDRKTRLNLEGFLKGNNIIPIDIEVTGTRNNPCIDCYCETGRIFRVKVYRSQLQQVGWFGFRPG